jgi:uncharacterized protein (TIGR00251 family)
MYLTIKVVPKSREARYVETMADGTIKIRLKSAPEKGKANAELFAFLAESFKIESSDIKIISGHTDTRKLIKIPDLTLPWPEPKNP